MSEDTIIQFISLWQTNGKRLLINVVLDQFLNIKVSQGSVATRLRCDGIFNDQFITQSLLSPRVKNFWKSVNICRSYGQLSTGLFFMKQGVYNDQSDSTNLHLNCICVACRLHVTTDSQLFTRNQKESSWLELGSVWVLSTARVHFWLNSINCNGSLWFGFFVLSPSHHFRLCSVLSRIWVLAQFTWFKLSSVPISTYKPLQQCLHETWYLSVSKTDFRLLTALVNSWSLASM